jgi:acyl-CoA dehydrogenase family member 9
MATLTELEQKQIAQAEELFFSGPSKEEFAKELYFGRFRSESVFPYPALTGDAKRRTEQWVEHVQEFCRDNIDPVAIDRQEKIPDSVILGLGEIGVLGFTIAQKYGGQGASLYNYCKVMEIIGGQCASTAVFVNAHHSIGLRAIELFGTQQQKETWLPELATGKKIAAFALTEPHAGSDASNVQTRATPTEDGKGFILTGEKRWITNGGIADVLTVMARTPDKDDVDGKITAFVVTPEMDGFTVLDQRMEKSGIRGTATGRMKFENVYVPRENILGPIGKGLKVALTVLDFGRTTFGACCTGTAKFCVERMIHRARTRQQFGQPLGEFELVKRKIAEAVADTYAMESATYHTAALIDSGAEDYMIETAMIKVFASDQLWRIVNDTMQVWGGAGFFTDQPFERMMRDARLNMIGEGANDVLRCFVAMCGLRGLGKDLEQIAKSPWKAGRMLKFAPKVPVQHEHLRYFGNAIGRQIARFAWACQMALVKHRESILKQQNIQARIGDIATEIFVSSCVYARLNGLMGDSHVDDHVKHRDLQTGKLYLKLAESRNAIRFDQLKHNTDEDCNRTADLWLSDPFDNWPWEVDQSPDP